MRDEKAIIRQRGVRRRAVVAGRRREESRGGEEGAAEERLRSNLHPVRLFLAGRIVVVVVVLLREIGRSVKGAEGAAGKQRTSESLSSESPSSSPALPPVDANFWTYSTQAREVSDASTERNEEGRARRTLDPHVVPLRIPHQQRRRLTVQGVRRVWVAEELGKEDLEDVDHVEHGRPSLVDHVEADRT